MNTKDMLRVSQKEAVQRIINDKKVGMFCGLGFGKTLVALTAAQELLEQKKVSRVLVIAPLRVAQTVWHKEIDSWAHLKGLTVAKCLGTPKKRTEALLSTTDIMVINRENIPWLIDIIASSSWDFDMVIFDESTSFKSHASKRFKAIKKILNRVRYSVLLSGTPSPNGEMDLWAQIYLLDNGERLGKNITAFRNRYFIQNAYTFQYQIQSFAAKVIREKISDICFYVDTKDVVDMPDLTYIENIVPLPPKIHKMVKNFQEDLVLELADGTLEGGEMAIQMGRILQMANGAVYYENGAYEILHDEKIKALESIVEDNPNENLLVAYSFKHDRERLLEAFPQARVITEENIELWNKGKIKMLIAHPASAGHGLNLQFGGSTCVWFGLNWSLELYEQFNGRLFRPGQKNAVKILHILSDLRIENDVSSALRDKSLTQNKLLSFLEDKL